MSTEITTRDLDEIASRAAGKVEGHLIPELWRQEEAYILCFSAPRTQASFPWFFKTTGTKMMKINAVHYIMPPDDVEMPDTCQLEFEGVSYIIYAQAFKVEGSTANFDHELTARLRDMFFEAIQAELLAT